VDSVAIEEIAGSREDALSRRAGSFA